MNDQTTPRVVEEAARMPSVEEVAEVMAEQIGWQPGIYEVAERVVALWGAL